MKTRSQTKRQRIRLNQSAYLTEGRYSIQELIFIVSLLVETQQ